MSLYSIHATFTGPIQVTGTLEIENGTVLDADFAVPGFAPFYRITLSGIDAGAHGVLDDNGFLLAYRFTLEPNLSSGLITIGVIVEPARGHVVASGLTGTLTCTAENYCTLPVPGPQVGSGPALALLIMAFLVARWARA